jgi:transcriptional regulator of acetoin/glycerol metabolism
MNKPITGIGLETRELMRAFDWPGMFTSYRTPLNVRCWSANQRNQPGDLPLQVSDSRGSATNGKALSDVERQHVKNVLEETGWNVYQAARLLEIDRVTLYNKIRSTASSEVRSACDSMTEIHLVPVGSIDPDILSSCQPPSARQ